MHQGYFGEPLFRQTHWPIYGVSESDVTLTRQDGPPATVNVCNPWTCLY